MPGPEPRPDLELALGRLLLAALLLLAWPVELLIDRLTRPEATPLEAVELGAVDRARLGGQVACDCPDPDAWQTLPRVGPVRARALARAAAAGELRDPADLLRIPGFGTKMARAVAARVDWTCGSDAPRAGGGRGP